jgi:FkbM family methyltransferase
MTGLVKLAARYVAGHLLPRIAYPVITGPLKGARIILGSLAGEGGGSSVYLNGVEPEQTAVFVETLKSAQVCFDVGASVGYYTLLASRLVGPSGRVVSFEPEPRNVAYLYRHMTLNKVNNVIVVPGACSNRTTIVKFTSGKNPAEGHIVDSNDGRSQESPCETIALSTTIDAITQHLGLHPNLIKIDVEGAELLVLHGAWVTLRDHAPTILLSTHSDQLRSDCVAYLVKDGYQVNGLGASMEASTEFVARCHRQ